MMDKVFYAVILSTLISVSTVSMDYIFLGVTGVSDLPDFIPSDLNRIDATFKDKNSSDLIYSENLIEITTEDPDASWVDTAIATLTSVSLKIPFFGELLSFAFTINSMVDFFVFYWMNSISSVPFPAPIPFLLGITFFLIKLALKFSLILIIVNAVGGIIK